MTALRRLERQESTGRMPRLKIIAILLNHTPTQYFWRSFLSLPTVYRAEMTFRLIALVRRTASRLTGCPDMQTNNFNWYVNGAFSPGPIYFYMFYKFAAPQFNL